MTREGGNRTIEQMSGSIAAVLKAECAAIHSVVARLSDEEFSSATRCSPWDVKDLLAHMWRDLFRIPTALNAPEPSHADVDAVTYWTSYDPKSDAARIAKHATETSAEYSTPTELVAAFQKISTTTFELGTHHPPQRRIALWWGPRMRLDEFLKTRVLEMVVHGLDLTDALTREPVTTTDGLAITTEILDGLLGELRPAQWDPHEYIRKGTGRQPLSTKDRQSLGDIAERLPLLA